MQTSHSPSKARSHLFAALLFVITFAAGAGCVAEPSESSSSGDRAAQIRLAPAAVATLVAAPAQIAANTRPSTDAQFHDGYRCSTDPAERKRRVLATAIRPRGLAEEIIGVGTQAFEIFPANDARKKYKVIFGGWPVGETARGRIIIDGPNPVGSDAGELQQVGTSFLTTAGFAMSIRSGTPNGRVRQVTGGGKGPKFVPENKPGVDAAQDPAQIAALSATRKVITAAYQTSTTSTFTGPVDWIINLGGADGSLEAINLTGKPFETSNIPFERRYLAPGEYVEVGDTNGQLVVTAGPSPYSGVAAIEALIAYVKKAEQALLNPQNCPAEVNPASPAGLAPGASMWMGAEPVPAVPAPASLAGAEKTAVAPAQQSGWLYTCMQQPGERCFWSNDPEDTSSVVRAIRIAINQVIVDDFTVQTRRNRVSATQVIPDDGSKCGFDPYVVVSGSWPRNTGNLGHFVIDKEPLADLPEEFKGSSFELKGGMAYAIRNGLPTGRVRQVVGGGPGPGMRGSDPKVDGPYHVIMATRQSPIDRDKRDFNADWIVNLATSPGSIHFRVNGNPESLMPGSYLEALYKGDKFSTYTIKPFGSDKSGTIEQMVNKIVELTSYVKKIPSAVKFPAGPAEQAGP